jgi:fatty-acyl-CoA synthase
MKGTTGLPKGVTLSHHNIVNNMNQLGHHLGYPNTNSILLNQVPLYHCFGMCAGRLNSLNLFIFV